MQTKKNFNISKGLSFSLSVCETLKNKWNINVYIKTYYDARLTQ